MAIKMGWFSTGRDEAARNLLKTVYDDLKKAGAPATVDWIFCHRELGDGPENEEARQRKLFFNLADQLEIPVKTLSHVRFMPDLRRSGIANSPSAADASPELEEWRNLFGEQVVKVVSQDPVDIVIMAGYMLIIGDPELLALDLVNIHPALPWGPRGTWQECILQIIDEKADEHGIMIHLVTKTLDRGPVISFCRFPLKGESWDHLWEHWNNQITPQSSREELERTPLFTTIRKTGEIRELPLLSSAIMELAYAKITILNKKIYAEGCLRTEGLELTEQIEEIIRSNSAELRTPEISCR